MRASRENLLMSSGNLRAQFIFFGESHGENFASAAMASTIDWRRLPRFHLGEIQMKPIKPMVLAAVVALAIAVGPAGPAAAQGYQGRPNNPNGTLQKPGDPAGDGYNSYGCYTLYLWTNVTLKGTPAKEPNYRRRDVVGWVCPDKVQ